ncbi:MAG: cysteine-rich CWC family protein [Planctomycetota bacterium]
MTPNDSQSAPSCQTTSECPRCQSRFVCGVARGESHCWCMELPAVMPVRCEAQCFCPACLAEAIEVAHRGLGETTPVDLVP